MHLFRFLTFTPFVMQITAGPITYPQLSVTTDRTSPVLLTLGQLEELINSRNDRANVENAVGVDAIPLRTIQQLPQVGNVINSVARQTESELALQKDLIQKGSQSDGNPTNGEAPSQTSNDNFIDDCQGKTLTNGNQDAGGSCNGIVMGDIPAQNKMVSTMITSPKTLEDLTPNQTFNVVMNIQNINSGSFTNAQNTYYAAPQAIGTNGEVIGHTHVTIQNMGSSINPTKALDAGTFVFFKGIDDAAQNDQLTATVTGGLPAGFYRVCTIASSSNHQPVLMPVAQRGSQDDCTKFTVGQATLVATGKNTGTESDNSKGNANNDSRSTKSSIASRLLQNVILR